MKWRLAWVGTWMLLGTGINGAHASLYCVVDFSGQRCHYSDLASCQEAAGRYGSCVMNRQQMLAPVGGAPFCLVEEWKTECLYRDLSSCQQQAEARRASCIANPNLNRRPPPSWGNSVPGSGRENPGAGSGRYLPSPGYDPRPGSR